MIIKHNHARQKAIEVEVYLDYNRLFNTPKMPTSGSENTSDEIIHNKCCICFEKKRTREADRFCGECKDYYCSPCSDTHKQFPATKGHKLLDKKDFRSLGPDGSLPCFPTQRCQQHQSEVINLYCKQHDEVACALCIALSHRTCAKINSIHETIDNLYNRSPLFGLKQKINRTKDTMEQIKKAKERKVKELKETFDKEVQSIKVLRKELETLLDKMEQETIKELKKEFEKIESSLTAEINCANTLIDDLNKETLQLKKGEGNKSQEFVNIKTAEKVTANTENLVKELQEKSEETVSFDADKNMRTLLQQIQAIGKNSKVKSLNVKDCLCKAKRQREIDVKLKNDTSYCSIHGSCMTEDGSLLFTDFLNKRLKRLDMYTERVNDYIDFKAEPCGVCLINKKEAAVTLNNQTVQFLSLGNKLTVSRKLQMKHRCYGLAHNDSKLYISDLEKTVYIYSINGKVLTRISTDASGKEIFHRTRHVTLNAIGDRVFVADENHGIVILDIHGNHLATLTHPGLSGSYGVCTDDKNLFVCGYSSNNIVQLGQDYTIIGELCKVLNPQSLCFDIHKTTLITTLHNNNRISVLELEKCEVGTNQSIL